MKHLIFLHSNNFPDTIFSSNMFWYFCCKTRYYLLLRLSKWLLYSQINLVFHWLLARVNEGNMIMLSVLITFWEIKSSCETLFAAVCEDDTETHLVLPNEPRHRTILNFFVPDVSILNLLNLLKARLWGERGLGQPGIDKNLHQHNKNPRPCNGCKEI